MSKDQNPLSRTERETHCRRSADKDTWDIYSDDPVAIRKLTRLHGPGKPMGQWGFSWVVPKNAVSLRSGAKRPGNPSMAGRFQKRTQTQGEAQP